MIKNVRRANTAQRGKARERRKKERNKNKLSKIDEIYANLHYSLCTIMWTNKKPKSS